MRSLALLFASLSALGLVACSTTSGDDGGAADGATDGATDGGRDAGARDLGTDLGPRDLGPDMPAPTCTTGCNIVEISSGFENSCARRENGEVLCWGRNYWGELGDGRMLHPGSDCLPSSGMAIDCSVTPVTVMGVSDATQLRSHYGPSTCARKMDGTYACWGWAFALGIGMASPTVRSTATPEPMLGSQPEVGVTWVRACKVNADHSISCMGSNDYGELGNNTRMSSTLMVNVMGITNAAEVVSGGHTCARLMDGHIKCWGRNSSGQLGDGVVSHTVCMDGSANPDCSLVPVDVATIDDALQVDVGSGYACAIRADHTVWCWGTNQLGQCGQTGLLDQRMPIQVPGLTGVAQLSTGDNTACAVLMDGHVKCWGYNHHGTVGDNASHMLCTSGASMYDCTAAPVGVVEMAPGGMTEITDGTQVAVGESHVCLLRASHQVFCWGENVARETGQTSPMGTYPDVRIPAQVTFPL